MAWIKVKLSHRENLKSAEMLLQIVHSQTGSPYRQVDNIT